MLGQIKQLESSEEFKDFKAKNKEAFLTHVFYMLDEANKNCVQIGYYNPKKDRITTFIVEGSCITKTAEAEVFKEQETVMKPLDMSRVKIDVSEAVEIAEKLQKDKYPADSPIKKIAILQHLPVGQVWNITFVTAIFKTLNIKIDSATKKVVSDKLISIAEFGKAS
jgi:hypothetical protein